MKIDLKVLVRIGWDYQTGLNEFIKLANKYEFVCKKGEQILKDTRAILEFAHPINVELAERDWESFMKKVNQRNTDWEAKEI